MTNSAIMRAANVTPSARQLQWQALEFYAFVHFTINTFTGREWGTGEESPTIFNPERLDADQWVDVFRSAGMRGLILTAKHHDGFCLWPSQHTNHSVRQSPWRDGHGDVVREVSQACNKAGLKFGVYLSPWDRHDSRYGTEEYNDYFKAQLRELLTHYGDIFCVWFDGACGEGPNGKRQVYDWDGYFAIIRELQPNAVISVCGPDVRWCGNEAGHCRVSEWSVVPGQLRSQERIQEQSQTVDDGLFSRRVNTGDQDLGSRVAIQGVEDLVWYPAEVNTSIRPGWFYHANEDGQVRSVDELLTIYYEAVGGNATFLLNVPPDPSGLIASQDATVLVNLGDVLRRTFARDLAREAVATASATLDRDHDADRVIDGDRDSFWCPPFGTESADVELDFGGETTFDHVVLQEHIASGQRIERFSLECRIGDQWVSVHTGTVVGYKRIVRLRPITCQRLRVRILESRWGPTLSSVGVYSGTGLSEEVELVTARGFRS